MTADEYVPSEARVCIDFCNAATARRGPSGDTLTMEEADQAFDRFLARVRRDAAREALDGYAAAEEDHFLDLHVKGAPISAAQCTHAAMTAREYRDTHYPEQED